MIHQAAAHTYLSANFEASMEMKEMDKRKPFRLTNRDREIVRAVYDYRALISSQINTLFFSKQGDNANQQKPSSRCLQRLRRLYEHGFLHRAGATVQTERRSQAICVFFGQGRRKSPGRDARHLPRRYRLAPESRSRSGRRLSTTCWPPTMCASPSNWLPKP